MIKYYKCMTLLYSYTRRLGGQPHVENNKAFIIGFYSVSLSCSRNFMHDTWEWWSVCLPLWGIMFSWAGGVVSGCVLSAMRWILHPVVIIKIKTSSAAFTVHGTIVFLCKQTLGMKSERWQMQMDEQYTVAPHDFWTSHRPPLQSSLQSYLASITGLKWSVHFCEPYGVASLLCPDRVFSPQGYCASWRRP